jgi:3-oxoacyl-[acyl-carrier protein] reductase
VDLRVRAHLSLRSVLVTGAARGLGAAIAATLREDGYAVVPSDIVPGDGLHHLDVREEASWLEAAEAMAAAGEPWGLVNCAAVTVVRDLFQITPAEWDEVLAVNLRGAFLGTRVIGPLLRERRQGRIVNISSDSACKGIGATGAHYAVSKAGLITLTKRSAAALAGDGVTVNAVAPGTLDGETSASSPANSSRRSGRRCRSAGWAASTRWRPSWRGSSPRARPT